MIKAVFFDIDGTLISFKTHRMPESTRRALKMLRAKGIKLFVATGRAPKDTDFLKEYFDFDGIVSFNGQYCFDKDGVIYQSPFPLKSVAAVLPYLAEHNIACCFETVAGNRFNLVDSRVSELLELVGMSHVKPVLADMDNLPKEIFQLTVYVTPEEEKPLMKLLPECKALRWSSLLINVIGKDAGKPVGIRKVAERYGIKREEIMVFGDGGNDVDMLKYAGVGVAMGNAGDEAKAAADYVTADVDDDGIFKALEHYRIL